MKLSDDDFFKSGQACGDSVSESQKPDGSTVCSVKYTENAGGVIDDLAAIMQAAIMDRRRIMHGMVEQDRSRISHNVGLLERYSSNLSPEAKQIILKMVITGATKVVKPVFTPGFTREEIDPADYFSLMAPLTNTLFKDDNFYIPDYVGAYFSLMEPLINALFKDDSIYTQYVDDVIKNVIETMRSGKRSFDIKDPDHGQTSMNVKFLERFCSSLSAVEKARILEKVMNGVPKEAIIDPNGSEEHGVHTVYLSFMEPLITALFDDCDMVNQLYDLGESERRDLYALMQPPHGFERYECENQALFEMYLALPKTIDEFDNDQLSEIKNRLVSYIFASVHMYQMPNGYYTYAFNSLESIPHISRVLEILSCLMQSDNDDLCNLDAGLLHFLQHINTSVKQSGSDQEDTFIQELKEQLNKLEAAKSRIKAEIRSHNHRSFLRYHDAIPGRENRLFKFWRWLKSLFGSLDALRVKLIQKAVFATKNIKDDDSGAKKPKERLRLSEPQVDYPVTCMTSSINRADCYKRLFCNPTANNDGPEVEAGLGPCAAHE